MLGNYHSSTYCRAVYPINRTFWPIHLSFYPTGEMGFFTLSLSLSQQASRGPATDLSLSLSLSLARSLSLSLSPAMNSKSSSSRQPTCCTCRITAHNVSYTAPTGAHSHLLPYMGIATRRNESLTRPCVCRCGVRKIGLGFRRGLCETKNNLIKHSCAATARTARTERTCKPTHCKL